MGELAAGGRVGRPGYGPVPFEGGSGPVTETVLISGETFGPREVTVSVRGGRAYFEGDIDLGPIEELRAAAAAGADGPEGAVVVTGAGVRWPDGVVPYVIDSSLTSSTTVPAAIRHWNERTPVRLVPRDARRHPDYVRFTVSTDPGVGGSSPVGHGRGERRISINPSGSNTGTVIHEIGHSVGLWHEQSREDRDAYVTVHLENVQPGREGNFNQHISDGDDVGPYDYGSIMHYPADAFTNGHGDTIVPRRPGVTIGQRTTLSRGDVEAAYAMYAPDPLPGPALAEGTWQTIRSGHRLVPLVGGRVLDWEPASGGYRVWRYDPTATGDPFPGDPVVSGTWRTIRTGHELVALSADRVLDWEPANGGYRVWAYDPTLTGAVDPLPGAPTTRGSWASVRTGHELLVLPGGAAALDWEAGSGHFRVWRIR